MMMTPLLTEVAVCERPSVFIADERCTAPLSRREICHACGTAHTSTTTPAYLRRGDARFCPDCRARLTASQVADIVRAVALQGIPLS